jgi:hypothetical protein
MRICSLNDFLLFFFIVSKPVLVFGMETEVANKTQGHHDTELVALGGVAATLSGIEMAEDGQEFVQRRALMEAVLTGCHVQRHMVRLPGRVDAISPTLAALWIKKEEVSQLSLLAMFL